jgi:hypothetical protein
MHHLYGIMEQSPQAARLPGAGVDDACVLARRIGGLTVLSTLVHSAPRPSRIALSRHLDVQAAVAIPGPFFPVPFGLTVPRERLEQWLAVRAGTIRAALGVLRGRTEMRVSLVALHAGDGNPARLCAVADRVAEASGVSSWRSRTAGTGANAAITLAFLIRAAEVPAFLARIAPVAARGGDVAVVPSGPWPATTFVPPLDGVPAPADERAVIPHAV